tara:strand:- start:1006 stop:1539 length:534 start_codon:yes stop_codon:yes gene_type:complete
MKKIFIIIFIFKLTISNAQDDFDITIEEIRHRYECRGCPGSLVVKKGNQVDTIYGGQWGNTPNYKLRNINDKNYIHTYGNYGFPLGVRVEINCLYSLEKKSFLEEVFKNEIITYRESHRSYSKTYVNYTIERNIKTTIENGFKFEIDLKVSACPELPLNEKCDEIMKQSYTEFYPIN